ncbi:MAG TPA: PilZ domain-containing protein [Rhizomicrobium sp.]|nr:PilZ domain-containing protein [Rhizomicrobium sp.]
MSDDRKTILERAKAERRQFKRVRVELAGRLFVPSDNREASCQVVDISTGGAQINCEIVPALDETVVLYIDNFGRFEGIVVRPEEGNFGVRFQCSAMKREKLAEQLTLYMNKDLVDASVIRRHDRTETKGLAKFTRVTGEIVNCTVLDLSLSGISLKSDVRPPIGEVVLIGNAAGRVARHHETGIALELIGQQANEKTAPEKLLNAYVVGR